jgi:hypothetical protein
MYYRYRLYLTFFSLMVLFLPACSQKPGNDQNNNSAVLFLDDRKGDANSPFVRVFNAIPKIQLDVFVNEKAIFANVPFASLTSYTKLTDRQTIRFMVCRAGDASKPLIERVETIGQGHHYTVVALPGTREQDPAITILSDSSNPPPVDQVRIRFINASPGIGDADLYSTNRELLFQNVPYESEGGYGNFPPPRGIEVRAEDDTRIARNSNVGFQGGRSYTIVVVGHPPKVRAISLEDEIGAD